jgi:hypothetical protein
VIANLAWVVICTALLSTTCRSASPFGIAHVACEAFFVALLAAVEYRYVRPLAR